MGRHALAVRRTAETEIEVTVDLDGVGTAEIDTGIGFFNHMLTAFALNARFDLRVVARGDLHVSQHHTVEDVGIVLGRALVEALGDRAGVRRYGCAYLPMDEALVRTVVDLSGRAYARVQIDWRANLGPTGFDYALLSEFVWGLARAGAMTVHVDRVVGENNHHMCEAAFKGLGRALDEATRIDPKLAGAVPSTKGSFDA